MNRKERQAEAVERRPHPWLFVADITTGQCPRIRVTRRAARTAARREAVKLICGYARTRFAVNDVHHVTRPRIH